MMKAYERLLASHPLRVKSVMGGAIGFCGDAVAQTFEARTAGSSSYDQQRGLAMTSFATFWNGWCTHKLFGLLDRLWPYSRLGVRSLVPKLLATQGVCNPFVFLPLFYVWTGMHRHTC